MSNFVLVTENYALDATLSGGSYDPELPLTNIVDNDIRAMARTTTAATTATKMIFDLGEVKQFGAVIIYNGNWSTSALYRVRTSNTTLFSTVRYDSGWDYLPGVVVPWGLIPYGDPDFWTSTLNNRLLSEYPTSLIHIMPDEERFAGSMSRYVEVTFDDTANAAGYLEFGYAMVGPTWTPSINYGEDNGRTVMPISDVSESMSGRRSWFERGIRRTWNGAFRFLENDEVFYTLDRLAVKQRDSRPVFIVPDQSDSLHLQSRSFLASVKQMSPIQQLLVTDRNSTGLTFEEWL